MFFLRVHLVHLIHNYNNMMNYNEIAKFLNFIKTSNFKREWNFFATKQLPDDMTKEIRGYNVYSILLEIQDNFGSNFYSERAIEQINLDYEYYLLELDNLKTKFFEDEQIMFEWKLNQIKSQLKRPTILQDHLIDWKLENKSESNFNKTTSNLFPKIFVSDIGYTIFIRLHELYKDKANNYLANYSSIFLNLKNDSLIFCQPSDYRQFLSENYDVTIEKIDTRQNNDSSDKSIAYNAIKLHFMS